MRFFIDRVVPIAADLSDKVQRFNFFDQPTFLKPKYTVITKLLVNPMGSQHHSDSGISQVLENLTFVLFIQC